ncbi:MAG: UDP-2,3-diacylglucosamine hydrolase [Candidatus Cloacimonetes bacterium HGW-Cloacimonetes-3]|jgi:UDP-2,3-diacylglucosamine hydrolase|nr:MAG: UDP-2,3-diacylglucosamine hydrolase [Candidatus Cloacimonetes bacterium HGW-Cloacimonetes-3]
MRILAISDCHYKYHRTEEADTHNAELLLSFLRESVGRYDTLVLVGDIFDLWFDWRYTIVKQYFPLLRVLAEIRDAGCRLLYLSGNHDFWFGDFLTEYIGCEIHPDGVTMEADGKLIRFEHGDIRTVNDLRYKLYRRVIRLNGVKRLFSMLHPDIALILGTFLSRTSRTRPGNPELRSIKTRGLKQYTKRLIQRKEADIVVMGHSHFPELVPLLDGFYANCGDWIVHHSYIEIIEGIPLLKQYNNKQVNQ